MSMRRSISFKDLLRSRKHTAKRIYAFDVRYGMTNVKVVGISKANDKYVLGIYTLPISFGTVIENAIIKSFENDRLPQIDMIPSASTGRYISVSNITPSEITIDKFVEMIDEGKIFTPSTMILMHGFIKLVDFGERYEGVMNIDGMSIRLRMYPNSSFWIKRLIEKTQEFAISDWETVMLVSLSGQAISNYGIYELDINMIERFGAQGILSIYAMIPLRPYGEEEVAEREQVQQAVEGNGGEVPVQETSEGNGEKVGNEEENEYLKAIGESVKQIIQMATGENDENQ